ncbi:copper chaperone PCu(A)C [Ovoidimarina sediminis]|uniref:copper chaperone PCu(A)C n=1 Tax=Ovoidimarina sediminis TaxID=3079856 RepID=UPI00291451E9|nr:copper chaperone PCu(A)C [Rhodophyticola sp. MJ-SS7]MDU8942864.1 copper chaperone PCu(A)C [Rhodophyticola sp. MJ-SS7]
MTRFLCLLATALTLWSVNPASAEEAAIRVEDAYVRAARPNAPVGAAFMILVNTGDAPDTLIGAASDAAERVELHTHIADADGIMRMRPVEGGISVPANGSHALKRGGDHVMFMGLREAMEPGGSVTVTLIFETAGEIEVEIPVDLERQE